MNTWAIVPMVILLLFTILYIHLYIETVTYFYSELPQTCMNNKRRCIFNLDLWMSGSFKLQSGDHTTSWYGTTTLPRIQDVTRWQPNKLVRSGKQKPEHGILKQFLCYTDSRIVHNNQACKKGRKVNYFPYYFILHRLKMAHEAANLSNEAWLYIGNEPNDHTPLTWNQCVAEL